MGEAVVLEAAPMVLGDLDPSRRRFKKSGGARERLF